MADYIGNFYNVERHSHLGNISPTETPRSTCVRW
jgi:hypothetical protein